MAKLGPKDLPPRPDKFDMGAVPKQYRKPPPELVRIADRLGLAMLAVAGAAYYFGHYGASLGGPAKGSGTPPFPGSIIAPLAAAASCAAAPWER